MVGIWHVDEARLRARLAAEGLEASSWGNAPFDHYSEHRHPYDKVLVAAAGPAVSLVLGVGLLAATHPAAHLSPLLGAMVSELGTLNMVLALFNLLPGLPLDGGLIVKALVWHGRLSWHCKGVQQ